MPQSAGTSGFAPAWGVHHCLSLQASEGGFQLRLKRTSARYDRARRPLDRVFRGGSWRKAPGHALRQPTVPQ